ncbi:MAG: DivIVA domain-containing protein [Rhodothermales bacterium]
MHLTPLDIRKQEFTRRVRGDDPDEVQAFLKMLADQWEATLEEQHRMEARLEEYQRKLAHYERIEEALEETLRTARQSARQTQETAEQKAKQIVDEAEHRADDIKREAEQDRLRLKRETAKLNGRRNEIVARLRAFLMSEMEMLAHFEGSDPVGFIKLIPGKEHAPEPASHEAPLPPAEAKPEAAEAPAMQPLKIEDGAEKKAASKTIGKDVHASPPPKPPTSELDATETVEPALETASKQPGGDTARPDEDVREPAGAAEESASPPREPIQTSEPVRSGPGWVNRPLVSSPSRYGGARPRPSEAKPDDADVPPSEEKTGEATRSGDELEKIRRILRDLD